MTLVSGRVLQLRMHAALTAALLVGNDLVPDEQHTAGRPRILHRRAEISAESRMNATELALQEPRSRTLGCAARPSRLPSAPEPADREQSDSKGPS